MTEKDYIAKTGKKNQGKQIITKNPHGQHYWTESLNYAEAKLFCNKISVPPRNPNRNTKPWWKIRLEGQVKKIRQKAKVLRKEKREDILRWKD